jgi:hypothetical protein
VARPDGGALLVGYPLTPSDMALTAGSVGYMGPMFGLETGEMVWLECAELGEWPEVYEMTLEAGVRAGVSLAAEVLG